MKAFGYVKVNITEQATAGISLNAQRVKYNVCIPELMVCFNHSTQKQTLDYLCIQPEEIKSVYANEI